MMNEEYTLTDELERKSIDALATVLTDLESGAESPATISYAVKVLFQATSGLVGRETFDLLSEVSKRTNEALDESVTRRAFIDPAKGQVSVLELHHGQARVALKAGSFESGKSVVDLKPPVFTNHDHEIDVYAAARERFEALAVALERRGYIELK